MKKSILLSILLMATSFTISTFAQEKTYEDILENESKSIVEKHFSLGSVSVGNDRELRFSIVKVKYSGGNLSFLSVSGKSYNTYYSSVLIEKTDLKRIIDEIDAFLKQPAQSDDSDLTKNYFMLKGKSYIMNQYEKSTDSAQSLWWFYFDSRKNERMSFDDFAPVLEKMKEALTKMN